MYPLIRSADGLQQRRKPVHVLADVGVEVAEPDALRRDPLNANLGLELGVLGDLGNCVMSTCSTALGVFAGARNPYQVAFW